MIILCYNIGAWCLVMLLTCEVSIRSPAGDAELQRDTDSTPTLLRIISPRRHVSRRKKKEKKLTRDPLCQSCFPDSSLPFPGLYINLVNDKPGIQAPPIYIPSEFYEWTETVPFWMRGASFHNITKHLPGQAETSSYSLILIPKLLQKDLDQALFYFPA